MRSSLPFGLKKQRSATSRPRPCASIPKKHQGSSSIYFCFGIVNRGRCYINDVTSTQTPCENLLCGLVCLIYPCLVIGSSIGSLRPRNAAFVFVQSEIEPHPLNAQQNVFM